MSIFTRL